MENHQLPSANPESRGGPGEELSRATAGSVTRYVEFPLRDSERGQEDSLLDYWKMVRRRKRLLVILTLLGAAGGCIFDLAQIPSYTAQTTLEIQPVNDNVLNLQNTGGGASSAGAGAIATQMRILQSRANLQRVVQRLKSEDGREISYTPSRLSKWLESVGLAQPAAKLALSYDQALAATARSVRARMIPQSQMLEVSCESPDARLAADFVNILGQEYIEQHLRARWDSSQRTNQWLAEQVEEQKKKLEKSEQDLQAYAQQAGLTSVSDKAEATGEGKLRSLQEELARAEADRMARQSKHEMAVTSPTELLPDVLNDATSMQHENQLTELRRQLAELSSSFTPAHYRVKRIQAQIQEVERALEKDRAKVLNRIRAEYQEAGRRERMLAAAYWEQTAAAAEQAQKAIHYGILKRDVDANRQLYESMLHRVKEANIASALRANNIVVVDAAVPPSTPYKPKPFQNSAMGLLAGLFLGVGIVMLAEHADRSVKAPGEGAACLRLPELGVIPNASADPPAEIDGKRGPIRGLFGRSGKGAEGTDRVELVTWQRKPSLLAESFRTTLASILFRGGQDRPRVIVITSPCAGEGKSTVASNLAIALSEINQRVLLIDADMRNPRLHDIFDLPNSWGLSDLLQESFHIAESPLEAVARETQIPRLFLLPSGPPTIHISQLLFSPRLEELLRRFRDEFDAVLIDTPPALQFSDARVLARKADGVALVLRSGHSRRDDARSVLQRLTGDRSGVLGMVLNDWNPWQDGERYYGSYQPKRYASKAG